MDTSPDADRQYGKYSPKSELPSRIEYHVADSDPEPERILLLAEQGDYYEIERMISAKRDELDFNDEEEEEDEAKEEQLQMYTGICDSRRVSALLASCAEGYSDCVRLLIESGCVDTDHTDELGRTALFVAAYNGDVGHERCAHELLVAGADLYMAEGETGWSPLHAAAYSGNSNICKMILAAAEEDAEDEDRDPDDEPLPQHPLYIPDAYNRLPLHVACQFGAPSETVQALLQRMIISISNSGNPFSTASFGLDRYGRSPLHLAALAGSMPAIATLPGAATQFENVASDSDDEGDEVALSTRYIDLRDNFGCTALQYVCMAGHFPCAMAMLPNRPNLVLASNEKLNVIHYAALNARSQIIEMLLQNCKSDEELALVTDKDMFGRTPLHAAAQSNHGHDSVETCRTILNAGEDIDITDGENRTPLMYACACGDLVYEGGDENSVDSSNALVVSFLLSMEASLAATDNFGMTAVHYASYVHDVQSLQACLDYLVDPNQELDVEEVLNAQDVGGLTAIHRAVLRSTPRCGMVLELLVQKEADINLGDNSSSSPLFHACLANNFPAIDFLLQHEADPEQCDDEGKSPLVALISGPGKSASSPTRNGDRVESIKAFLDHPQVEPQRDDIIACLSASGRTPAHFAAERPDISMEVCRVLLEYTTVENLLLADAKGLLPSHLAASCGNIPFLKFCISHGVDLEAEDNFGQTLLFYAVMSGHLEVVMWAKSQGAQFLKCNKAGCNLLHLAARRLQATVGRYLLCELASAGADAEIAGEGAVLGAQKDRRGRIPLFYALLAPRDSYESSGQEWAEFCLLLTRAAEGEAPSEKVWQDRQRNHFLHAAFHGGRVEEGLRCFRLLQSSGTVEVASVLTLANKGGLTPLHLLLGSKYFTEADWAQAYAAMGASGKVTRDSQGLPDGLGKTLLHWACEHDRATAVVPSICESFFDANPHTYDASGRAPIHVAAGHASAMLVNALLTGIRTESGEGWLLPPADPLQPDKTPGKLLPLHYAAQQADPMITAALAISMGAAGATADAPPPLLVPDADGCIPLHHAVKQGRVAQAATLLGKNESEVIPGAENAELCKLQANFADSRGRSPLHLACLTAGTGKYGTTEELVRLLLDKEADPFAKDENESTPLDLAREKRLMRVQHILKGAMRKLQPEVSDAVLEGNASGGGKPRMRAWASRAKTYNQNDGVGLSAKEAILKRYRRSRPEATGEAGAPEMDGAAQTNLQAPAQATEAAAPPIPEVEAGEAPPDTDPAAVAAASVSVPAARSAILVEGASPDLLERLSRLEESNEKLLSAMESVRAQISSASPGFQQETVDALRISLTKELQLVREEQRARHESYEEAERRFGETVERLEAEKADLRRALDVAKENTEREKSRVVELESAQRAAADLVPESSMASQLAELTSTVKQLAEERENAAMSSKAQAQEHAAAEVEKLRRELAVVRERAEAAEARARAAEEARKESDERLRRADDRLSALHEKVEVFMSESKREHSPVSKSVSVPSVAAAENGERKGYAGYWGGNLVQIIMDGASHTHGFFLKEGVVAQANLGGLQRSEEAKPVSLSILGRLAGGADRPSAASERTVRQPHHSGNGSAGGSASQSSVRSDPRAARKTTLF